MWTQPGVFASPGKVRVFAEHHFVDVAWGWEAMASKNLQNQPVLNIKDLHVFSICSVRK